MAKKDIPKGFPKALIERHAEMSRLYAHAPGEGEEPDPEFQAKADRLSAPVPAPLVFGYGLEQGPDGYRACRISSRGTVEYIGPRTKTGEHRAESKALALSRAFEAFTAAFAPPSKMRYSR